jgi:uncharacterized membrane protein YbhN (UPF0104 family)
MINDKIDKSAAEKNEKSLSDLTEKADTVTSAKLEGDGAEAAKAATSSFDIAKFAGIFAAIGMAIGFIGEFLVAVISGAASLKLWQLLLVIVGILLLISGPSMFIAWRKLRRRDLGPVLNANGWAINAKSLVNVRFGKTLTSLAKFPKLTAVDPAARKQRFWRWFCGIVICLVVAGCVYWCLSSGKCFKKAQPEAQQEQVEQAPAADPVVETPESVEE